MSVTVADIADVAQSTLSAFKRNAFTLIANDLQKYVAMDQLLRKNRVMEKGGKDIRWKVMTDTAGNARNVKLYETDQVNKVDTFIEATVPWRHSQTAWMSERREGLMNQDGPDRRKILDMITAQRTMAMLDMVELCENNFWGKPATSADVTTPWGIDQYIVRSATTPTGGFTGGNPAGFSDCAGISSSTYANWKNWSFNYTNATKDDLVVGMRKAATFTKWTRPVKYPEASGKVSHGIYTNYAVIAPLEKELENQNDNLGNDLASKDGKLMFRGTSIEWVPKLDADTANPIYGIDWGTVKFGVLSGDYLTESAVEKAANAHNVAQAFIDLTYNLAAMDRRRLWVGYVA